MRRIYAKPFVEASELIGQLMNAVVDPNVHTFHSATRKFISERLERLIEQLEAMNFEMTNISARRLLSHVNDERVTVGQCRDYLHQTRDRLVDEIGSTYILCLTNDEISLYEPASPPYGKQVANAFPSVAYDVNEAAKCLALGRSTASAFHAIRCLEAAIRAISRCLGIPDPTKAHERNWGKMLGAVKGEIDRRWPTNSDRMTGDGQAFDEVHAALAAIQNPWRNATMHLDQKYTEEEVKHIFDIVCGLMKKVASRCDEDGEPKA